MTRPLSKPQQKLLMEIAQYNLNASSFSKRELRSISCLLQHQVIAQTDQGQFVVTETGQTRLTDKGEAHE